jgi:hypothetical protein
MRRLLYLLPWALATALLTAHTPAAAQAAQSVEADLRMAQDAAPFRRAADAFVASALAGDAAKARAMLSPALVARSGDAAIQRALDTQILPFFASGKAPGRSVTVTRTTDAAGQQGFAFYMWLQGADASVQRPSPCTSSRSKAASPSPMSSPTAWSKAVTAEPGARPRNETPRIQGHAEGVACLFSFTWSKSDERHRRTSGLHDLQPRHRAARKDVPGAPRRRRAAQGEPRRHRAARLAQNGHG